MRPRSQAWFAESQARFRRRTYGRSFTAALHALATRVPASPAATGWLDAFEPEPPDARWPADPRIGWIELSPSPFGFPAAGRRLAGGTTANEPLVPEAIWRRLAPGRYWLRALDSEDREVFVRCVERVD